MRTHRLTLEIDDDVRRCLEEAAPIATVDVPTLAYMLLLQGAAMAAQLQGYEQRAKVLIDAQVRLAHQTGTAEHVRKYVVGPDGHFERLGRGV